MKDFEFRLLIIVILGLLLVIVALSISLEKAKDDLDIERHNKTLTQNVSTVSYSLCNGGCCCVEGLR
jgi:hypothetical protein